VPPSLVWATIRAAGSLTLAGVAPDGIVPTAVANLSRGVIRGLLLSRLRLALALVFMTVAGMSIVLAAASPADDPPRDPQQGAMSPRPGNAIDRKARPRADEKISNETKLVRGRVVDPAGEPVAGARVCMGTFPIEPLGSPEQVHQPRSTSGADGRFEFVITSGEMDRAGADFEDLPLVSAHLRGFGPGWTRYDPRAPSSDLTVRLRPDDVPIEGRVIDLEGRPVPGVAVSAFHLWDYPPELFEESAGPEARSIPSSGDAGGTG
jgi:hypothetical protein